MAADILQDILRYTLDGATLEGADASGKTTRLICQLPSGERVAIQLESVVAFQAEKGVWPDTIRDIQIRTGASVRAAAWLAFERARPDGKPDSADYDIRNAEGLTFFALTLDKGSRITCLCDSVVILPALEENRAETEQAIALVS
ncbi:MAG: hypothetical protein AAF321_03070 [Pseudomonadota bacterium]